MKRVVDLGAGNGALCKTMVEDGLDVSGFDVLEFHGAGEGSLSLEIDDSCGSEKKVSLREFLCVFVEFNLKCE